jgi:uncharacterized protein
MQALVPHLTACGLDVVRFDFPYRERGRRIPDAMPVLQAMGGRVATMLAAQGFACDGLLLFAYPLHPDGKPEKLRDAHLPAIRVPVLCINGSEDRLCRRDLMERVMETVNAPWRMEC